MKTITIAFPRVDLKALLEDKQRQLTFVTNEHGEPIQVILQVRENLPLGQKPRKFGGRA